MMVAVSTQPARSDRRSKIAEAGIRLIATGGVRALTHRAIDAELGLPAGSTSYYARTRHDLVRLIVGRLAAHTARDIDVAGLPDRLSPERAAAVVARGLAATARRTDEHLARIALHIEYRNDPVMLSALEGDPPVRARLNQLAQTLLSRLGVADPARHAPDVVALVDGLLMQWTVRGDRIDVESIVRAYLDGVLRGQMPGPPDDRDAPGSG